MARALESMSEMQMVALGRMRVSGAVVVIDDSVGSVLQADCKLLSCLLNAGAARIPLGRLPRGRARTAAHARLARV